jgi:hypothetical protein
MVRETFGGARKKDRKSHWKEQRARQPGVTHVASNSQRPEYYGTARRVKIEHGKPFK